MSYTLSCISTPIIKKINPESLPSLFVNQEISLMCAKHVVISAQTPWKIILFLINHKHRVTESHIICLTLRCFLPCKKKRVVQSAENPHYESHQKNPAKHKLGTKPGMRKGISRRSGCCPPVMQSKKRSTTRVHLKSRRA